MSLSTAQALHIDRAYTALAWARELATSEEGADGDVAAALQRPSKFGSRADAPASTRPLTPTAEEWQAMHPVDVRRDLDALLLGRRPHVGLDALLETGFLAVWLPEIGAMVGFGDGEFRHKDVWKHTKQVVWQSVPRLNVRWGSLLHDIGKPKTRSIGDNGEVHFFGHAEVGASMFKRRVAKRLAFEGELLERTHFLILNHLRASQYDGSWTDSAVRRFAKEMGEGLKDLLDLSRADITTKRPEKKKRGLRQISELSRRIKGLAEKDAKVPPLPKGLGTAIAEAFAIPPSKRLGELRTEIETRCDRGDLPSHQDVDFYIGWMRDNASTLGL